MLPWSSPWSAEEDFFLSGASPPLPSLALVSEGAVSHTFTIKLSRCCCRVFYTSLNMLLQGHH